MTIHLIICMPVPISLGIFTMLLLGCLFTTLATLVMNSDILMTPKHFLQPDLKFSLLSEAPYAFQKSKTIVLGHLNHSISSLALWLVQSLSTTAFKLSSSEVMLIAKHFICQWLDSYWGVVLSNGALEASLCCDATVLLPRKKFCAKHVVLHSADFSVPYHAVESERRNLLLVRPRTFHYPLSPSFCFYSIAVQ